MPYSAETVRVGGFLGVATASGTRELTDLVQCLTWSDPALTCPSRWKQHYLQYLEDKLRALVEDRPELGAIRGTISLEGHISPRLIWALTRCRDTRLAASTLLAELSAAARSHQSATGDFPDGAAPRAERILIDFESPIDLPGPGFESLAATPEAQRKPQSEGIARALAALRPCHIAFSFVSLLTSRIVIRSQPERPTFVLIGSFTEYPGLTLFVNPWQSHADTALLIDALVHESIHHAIAMYEPLRHDLTGNRHNPVRYRSPWTGNQLTCHQYVEACFVWWGLYQLWLRWPSKSVIPEHRSRALYDRAAKGFWERPVTSLLSCLPRPAALRADTTEALRVIEDSALQIRAAMGS